MQEKLNTKSLVPYGMWLSRRLSTELHFITTQNTVILISWNKGFALEAAFQLNGKLLDPEFWREATGPDEIYEHLTGMQPCLQQDLSLSFK
jgi:hypothetical protein